MKEMYKDNAGNWRYGIKGEELGVSYSADSIMLPNCVKHAEIMQDIEEQMKKKLLPMEELEEFVKYTDEKMKEACGSSEFVFYNEEK